MFVALFNRPMAPLPPILRFTTIPRGLQAVERLRFMAAADPVVLPVFEACQIVLDSLQDLQEYYHVSFSTANISRYPRAMRRLAIRAAYPSPVPSISDSDSSASSGLASPLALEFFASIVPPSGARAAPLVPPELAPNLDFTFPDIAPAARPWPFCVLRGQSPPVRDCDPDLRGSPSPPLPDPSTVVCHQANLPAPNFESLELGIVTPARGFLPDSPSGPAHHLDFGADLISFRRSCLHQGAPFWN